MGLTHETVRSFTGVIEVAKTREGATSKIPNGELSPPKLGAARSAGGIS